MIVMMAGLPGTGKSTLARALARRVAGAVLDKDVIRAALFAPEHIEYSAAQDDFCQELMLRAAEYLMRKDEEAFVFLDGRTFSQRYQRERAIKFCEEEGYECAWIECVCEERTALDRLRRDAAAGTHPAANRTPKLYRSVRDSWEEIEGPKIVIDTEGPVEGCVEQALRELRARIY